MWLFVTPWTVGHQAPPSTEFSRQEYWSGLPFPSPRDLPNSGIKPGSPALQADASPSEPPGKLKNAVDKVRCLDGRRVVTCERRGWKRTWGALKGSSCSLFLDPDAGYIGWFTFWKFVYSWFSLSFFLFFLSFFFFLILCIWESYSWAISMYYCTWLNR